MGFGELGEGGRVGGFGEGEFSDGVGGKGYVCEGGDDGGGDAIGLELLEEGFGGLGVFGGFGDKFMVGFLGGRVHEFKNNFNLRYHKGY